MIDQLLLNPFPIWLWFYFISFSLNIYLYGRCRCGKVINRAALISILPFPISSFVINIPKINDWAYKEDCNE